jgi:Tfp pilus assembly protein PilO
MASLLCLRLFCVPLLGRLAAVRLHLREVDARLAEGAALIGQRTAHDTALARAQQQYAAATQRLGADTSLARVLETFKAQAQNHRLEFTATQPRAAEAAPRLVTMGEGLTLREVPLTLQLTGRYRHIGEFLAGLTEEPFAVAVRSLKMARAETSRTQVRAELLLMVYLTEGARR